MDKVYIDGNLRFETEEGIGRIVLNNPPSNKMDVNFIKTLNHILRDLLPVSGARALVIYGKGRHFSSGADLDELVQNFMENSVLDNAGGIKQYPELLLVNPESNRLINSLNIPAIALISGVCVGSAFELALACHIRLCTENCIIGLPESTFGLMPGSGGTQYLPKIIGKSKALETILKGDTYLAQDAYQLGLVDAVCSGKNLAERVIPCLKKILLEMSLDHISNDVIKAKLIENLEN